MESSKENVFKMEYTSVFGQEKIKKEKWTSKLAKFINENKLISITLAIFAFCVSLNFILVFNFVRIIENM